MMGERIKGARQLAGLSLRELALRVGVSHTAIQKYETGQDVPGSHILLRLVDALGVKVEYFFRPTSVTLSAPSFRSKASLRPSHQDSIVAQAQDVIERQLEVESLFPDQEPPQWSLQPWPVNSMDDIEHAAVDLRHQWNLGLYPIENLVGVLEGRGIRIALIPGHDAFDAMALWANERDPVIALKQGVPGDRQRFNLAHELGHLVLAVGPALDEEKAANRFAGAFLVPAPMVRDELGPRRTTLNTQELKLLKHKYGLSMGAWVYRAQDLGIISDKAALAHWKSFAQRGWRTNEPAPIPPERPTRTEQLVMRAVAEDIISYARAAELLGVSVSYFWEDESNGHESASSR